VNEDVAEGISNTYVLMAFTNNTSTDKNWILDSGSAVHVCSQKEMFNSLIVEKGSVKMVYGLASEASTLRQSML